MVHTTLGQFNVGARLAVAVEKQNDQYSVLITDKLHGEFVTVSVLQLMEIIAGAAAIVPQEERDKLLKGGTQ